MNSEQDDIVVASTTSTQAELDHVVGDDWRTSPEPAAAPIKEEPKEEVKEDPSSTEKVETAADLETAKLESDPYKKLAGETEDQFIKRHRKREKELSRDRDYARQRAKDIEEESRERERKLEERLAKLEQGAAKPAAKAEDNPKPELKDFANETDAYEKWVEAVAEWKSDQRITARIAQQQKDVAEATEADERQAESDRQKKTFDAYNAQVDKTREKFPDWDEVITAGADVPMTEGVRLAVVEAENGPEVAYYLCTHKDEAKALNAMSVPRAMVEVGKISARLQKSDDTHSPERRPVSSAVAPIRPVGARGATSVKTLDSMDMDEYNRVRDEQQRSRNR